VTIQCRTTFARGKVFCPSATSIIRIHILARTETKKSFRDIFLWEKIIHFKTYGSPHHPARACRLLLVVVLVIVVTQVTFVVSISIVVVVLVIFIV
jgi:hypothetical protein